MMNTTLQTQTYSNHQMPPAISIPLLGRHLIEASAGTGKTWTLTGVVLRLLVEAGYPCHKIIATTFTRSASAEMRQRIRERLQDFYQLLYIINHTSFEYVIDNNSSVAQKVTDFMDWLANQAKTQNLVDSYHEPINQHLIQWIANQVFTRQSSKQTLENQDKVTEKSPTKTAIVDFKLAFQRIKMAINQLDQLFVGTLDSLCQKWLREFGNETGYSPNVQITNDTSSIIRAMVHDQLRAFWTQVYQHEPEIYRSMQQDKVLDIHHCIKAVNKALNFYTTPIDAIQITSIDILAINTLKQKIVDFYDEEFFLYLDVDYRKQQGFDGRSKLMTGLNAFQQLQQQLSTATLRELLKLDNEVMKLIQAIVELITEGKGFKSKFEQQKEKFQSFSVVQDIYQLHCYQQQIKQHMIDLKTYFLQFISRYVREKLPQVLEVQHLTTFSLQLAKLNQALQGEQGDMLARYIRYQYPVALIDESQDINTEQALLIQRIYLKDDDNESKQNSLFLLLVGDPKQAIYGFRGGDVHNYNTLKKMFPRQPLQLLENRRSSQALIDAINGWYGVGELQSQTNEINKIDLPCYLGEGIEYQRIIASRQNAELTSINDDKHLPVFYQLKIESEQSDDDNVGYDDMITRQILAWFADDYQEKLQLNGQNLTLSDVCVLACQHSELDKVERKLQQYGIATIRGGSQSVFAESMAKDLLLLMAVLLNPYHRAKLKMVLLSHFFQLTLEEASQLMENNSQNGKNFDEILDKIQQLFIKANEIWQKNNFLSAIQWLLNQELHLPNQTTQHFWQRLASHQQGERLLIDLRHLLEIISSFCAGQTLGEYQLYDWYHSQIQNPSKEEWALQQRLSSEIGVILMTVHQSKGLEFPIVFMVGFDGNVKDKDKSLYLYSVHNQQTKNDLLNRRLSAQEFDYVTQQNFAEIQLRELFEERLRLLYVAITRAKERVYLLTTDSQRSRNSVLKNFIDDKYTKKINLLPFIQPYVTVIEKNSLSKYHDIKKHKLKNNPEKNTIKSPLTNNSENYKNSIEKITEKHFMGWDSTSFTRLKRYTQHAQQDNIIYEPKDDDIMDDMTVSYPAENIPIRFRFERGDKAGTFLHKVLEDLLNQGFYYQEPLITPADFEKWQPPKFWDMVINRALQQQKMPEHYFSPKDDMMDNLEYLSLAHWLNEIVHTPLLATGQRLIDIKSQQKMAEMGFEMRLNQPLLIKKLNELFKQYHIPVFLQEHRSQSMISNYLRGEIDLVYQYDEKFYVVDYKSNYLGDKWLDYQMVSLQQKMTEDSYWLQACIYQVALHRFLQLRLPNYDINQHLGKVEYAFLRGMSPFDNQNYGRLVCEFPVALILELDELFG